MSFPVCGFCSIYSVWTCSIISVCYDTFIAIHTAKLRHIFGDEDGILLASPAKPTDKTYGELVKKLTEHYSPTPSEVMQRFRFNSRSRRTEESVAAYMADLRRLAEHCNYGDTLDKMLTDRLVWGINDAGIQRKLLQENDPLTLARALTIATGAETADKNLKEMKAPAQELDSTSSSQASVKVKVEPVQKIHA